MSGNRGKLRLRVHERVVSEPLFRSAEEGRVVGLVQRGLLFDPVGRAEKTVSGGERWTEKANK